QRGTVVRAAFVDGVELAVLVEQHQRLFFMAEQAAPAHRRHLRCRHFHPPGHQAQTFVTERSSRARCSCASISHGGWAPASDRRWSIAKGGTAWVAGTASLPT